MNGKKYREGLRVLFAEPNLTHTSPVTTLSHAIKKAGGNTHFVDFTAISTLELIRLYLKVDVLVIQFYGVIDSYARKQIALATLLGVAVIRNWAGTDVLKSLTEKKVRFSTIDVNNLISLNITDNHQGLVEELSSIGIDCILTPKVIDYKGFNMPNRLMTKAESALVYLPASNREFYGSKCIENLIIKFPQLKFIIIADEEHVFGKYPNVESMGWVKDMEAVWNKSGVLIRITKHDGYPRMCLEAFSRGKYVIHNNKFEGVWFAKTDNEIENAVQHFIDKSEPNHDGVKVAKKALNSGREKKLYMLYSEASVGIAQWVSALKEIYQYYVGKETRYESE